MDIKLEQVVAIFVRGVALLMLGPLLIQSPLLLSTGAYGLGFQVFGLLVLHMVVICVLWVKAAAIAHKLIPAYGGQKMRISFTVEEMQALCFSAIGFWLAIHGVTELAQVLFRMFTSSSVQTGMDLTHNAITHRRSFELMSAIGPVLNIMLGVCAMAGASGIVKFLKKTRA